MPNWIVAALRFLVIVLMPVFLVLTNVRLLITDTFLRYEYGKTNFPADTYGFTQVDRLTYSRIAMDYLLNPEGIEFLGRQTFPDGAPQYNERELKHMADVKRVVRAALAVWILSGVVVVGGTLLLGLTGQREAARSALVGGAGLTVLIFLGILSYIALNFDALFVQFHQVFFESGTWQFAYSDTLIRLFPLKFWQDVFVLLGGGSLVEALLIGGVAWWGLAR